MKNKYTVVVKSGKNTRRISVESVNPMEAHKEVYMRIKNSEEVDSITDDTGDVVFNIRQGFSE
tara:strand:- start:144 stop:332 length:189 start_codon:yes stop_codon:yes gene_type:complete